MTGETAGAIGYGVVAGGLFLADAVGALPGFDGLNLTQVSSIGFAIWYGWYVTTRAIPRIVEQHGVQLLTATTAFREELAAIRREREADRQHFQCKQSKETGK